MNLVIDLGNTYGKIAVCEGTEIIESAISEKITNREIAYFINTYEEIYGAIFSSVANHSRELIDYLDSSVDYFLELSINTPLPFINHYKTPATLGYDRIAAVCGAHTIFPGKNVLVIDAGTAVTYDLITSKGEYLGGNISPGMVMRFKALNKFTNRLPMLEANDAYVKSIGTTTEEAVTSGVVNGLVYEIESYISKLSSTYRNLQVVLTGGDAKSFDNNLKSSIFVVSHLNLIGLNRILDYNVHNQTTN
ncbi:type III pantothenate kinase [Bacteroidota bacterium]